MEGTDARTPNIEEAGRLVGTRLQPPEIEASFRTSTLREDGRAVALVTGTFTLLTLPFVANDLVWSAPAGRLGDAIVARLLYVLTGLAAVVIGLRARNARALDVAVLANAVTGAAFTIVLQSTRPADYYLPVMINALAVVIFFTGIPNTFVLQSLAAVALTGSAVAWLVAFRVPPAAPVGLLIGFCLLLANLTGGFASWRLNRLRRLRFLAERVEAAASARLRESEARFRSAFENASIGKALSDRDGRFLMVNDAFCRMLGYTAAELTGLRFTDVTHPDDLEGSQAMMRALLDGAGQSQMTKRYLRKDGRVAWAEVGISLLRDRDGRPLHFIVAALDVTERRRTEEALADSRTRFAELHDSLGDGIVSVDLDGTIVDFNEAYRRMVGYEAGELRGMTFWKLTPERWHAEESRRLEEQARAKSPTATYEKEYRRKDGTVFPIEVRAFISYADGKPARMWAIVRDITEARAMREQLAVTSRLAAMGTLVAGVAHEINNPLGGAIASHGFVADELARLREMLRSGEPIDPVETGRRLDEVADALGDAQAGQQRVAAIVKDLTLLGRPDAGRSRFPLGRAADESMRWIPAPLRQRADVEIRDAGAPEVLASDGQIAQVVANLVTNAIRAAPEGQRASIRIGIGPGEPGFARIEVADDGAGMAPDVMAHIFDPFFTTREVGQGMGLGLSICHAIVTAHGGSITVRSEPGKGSTFRVELPAAA